MTHTRLKSPFHKLSENAWVRGAAQRPKKERQPTLLRNWVTAACWNLFRGTLEV